MQTPSGPALSPLRRACALAVLAGLCLATPALAQPATKPKKPPAKPATNQPVPTPAQAPAPAPAAQPGKLPKPTEPGPYIRQTDLEYYSFKTMLHIYKSGETQSVEGTRLTFRYEIPFETMTLVFPMIPATSAATPRYSEANGLLELGGPAVIDGRFLPAGSPSPKGEYPHRPEILDKSFAGTLYHSGISLAKFAVGEPKVQRKTTSVAFTIDLPMTASNTVFDEEKGLLVPWPKGPWPEVAASTFQPQQWVDYEARPDGTLQRYDEGVFKTLTDKWLQGLDPQKDLTPAQTAKMLMGGLVRDIKPDRNILNYRLERPAATGNDTTVGGSTFLVGLQVRGAEYAARSPDGAGEWDVACLSAAVFRRCGLPTRIVVGYDRRDEEEKDKGRSLKARVRAWVEFYLFDEAANTGNWVICDPCRLRKSMNQPPPLTQKWKYFGTHDEMSAVIPFAFHFVPPTDVRSYGAPAFWGWLVTPGMPTYADTAISFTARKTAVPNDRAPNQDKPYGR